MAEDRRLHAVPDGEPSPGALAKAANPGRYYAVTPGGDLESLRGDLHHLLNPWIGLLRSWAIEAVGVDPVEVPYAANTGPQPSAGQAEALEGAVPMRVARVVGLVHALQVATELADFALGEDPLGDQIDRMRADVAAEQGRSPWRPAPEGLEPHDFVEDPANPFLCQGVGCGMAPGHPIHHGGS
jgi:hypothetical protein